MISTLYVSPIATKNMRLASSRVDDVAPEGRVPA